MKKKKKNNNLSIYKVLLRTKKIILVLLVLGFFLNTGILNVVKASINMVKDPVITEADNHVTNQAVELTYLRESNLKVFLNPDYTLEYVYYDQDIHYFDGNSYHEITNSIKKVGTSYKFSNNQYEVLFPQNLKDESISLTYNNHTISWQYHDINNVQAEIAGDTAVKYSNILNNASIEFCAGNSLLKENVILEEYIPNFSFSYDLNIGNLVLVQTNNEITLKNGDGTPIYNFNPRFMYDSVGAISNSIDVKILKLSNNIYRFIVTPSDEWLSLETISYPVVIDPIVSIQNDTRSLTFRSNSFFYTLPAVESFGPLYVGRPEWEPGGIFSVAEITKPSSSMDFSNALIIFTMSSSDGGQYGNGGFSVYRLGTEYVFDNINSYPANIPSNNMTNIVGYAPYLSKEMTIPFNDVFLNNQSKSILYFSPGGSGYASLNAFSGPSPILRITNVTTLFPDTNFYTFNNDNAGNGKINIATGELVYSFVDSSLNHANSPLNILHTFKSLNANVDTPYGKGWNSSYHETLEKVGVNYNLTRDNGSKISFYYDDEGNYKSVDGNQYILTEKSNYVEISDGNTVETYSYLAGNNLLYLTKIKDIKTGGEIVITYKDTLYGKGINTVTDGALNRAEYIYNNNLLTSINIYKKNYDNATTLNHIEEVIEYSIFYTYDSNNRLTKVSTRYLGDIINEHPSTINISYNNINLIDYVYYGNSELQELGKKFEYCLNETGFLNQFKVASFRTYIHQGGSTNDVVSFVYGLNKAKVTNYDGTYNRYWYDVYGNVLKEDNEKAQVIHYLYDNSPINQHNLIDVVLSPQSYVNYINNPTYRSNNGWGSDISGNAGSVYKVNSTIIPGNKQMALARTSTNGGLTSTQNVNLNKGKYIISTLIRNDALVGGAYVTVSSTSTKQVNTITSSQKVLNTNGEFVHYYLEFEILENNTNVLVSLTNDSIGQAYFDYIDLNTETRYSNFNLVEDSSFERWDSWGGAWPEGMGWPKIFGPTTGIVTPNASQTIPTSGYKGDKFDFNVFYGFAYQSPGFASANIKFSIIFDYADFTKEEFTFHSNELSALMENGFTFDSIYGQIYAKKDYVSITIKIQGYGHEAYCVDNMTFVRTRSRVFDLQQKINNFPSTLNFDTYQQVLDAQALFDDLTEQEVALLSDYYANILKNKYRNALVLCVTNELNDLPPTDLITIDDIYAVYYVYEIYQLLDEEGQQSLGTIYQNIMLKGLEKSHIIEVIEAIENLPEVITLYNRYLVYETEELFNNLTDVEKNQIINENVLSTKIIDADALGSREIAVHKTNANEEFGYNHQFVVKIIDELLNDITYTYNSVNGQMTSHTDQLGNKTEYFYNVYELLSEIKQYVTNLTSEGYATVSYEYDSLNRLNKIITVSATYDIYYSSSGNVKEIKVNNTSLLKIEYVTINGIESDIPIKYTYGNGFVIDYILDSNNYVVGTKYNNVLRFTYKYDYSYNLIESNDIIQGISYFNHYDANQNLIMISDSLGNKVSFNHDDDGKMGGISYSIFNQNKNVSYLYNENGELIKEQLDYFSIEYEEGIDSSVQRILINSIYINQTFGYNNSLIEKITYSKGENNFVEIEYTYDAVGNITTQTLITYSNGFITKVIRELYYYNELYELVIHKIFENTTLDNIYDENPILEVEYDYDLNGNIKSIYRPFKTGIYANLETYVEYNYNNNWKDLLSSIVIRENKNGPILTTYTYQYDDIGNINNVYKNGSLYEKFTYEGRTLVSYEKIDEVLVEYAYNTSGVRNGKKVYHFDNGTSYLSKSISYFLDGVKIIGEQITEGNFVSTIFYYYNANEELIGFNYTDNENTNSNCDYIYVKNLQGDVIEILDSNGDSIVKYVYDAFGRLIDITGNQKIGQANSFRYRGYYYDNETELYYLQSRYYDADLGRFINADSPEVLGLSVIASEILGTNLFSYCYNNPIMNYDPSGFWVISIGLEINAAMVILGGYFAVGFNFDGKTVSLTWSAGMLMVTNISASLSVYGTYLPNMKSVNDLLNGTGVSLGIAFSLMGAYGAGGSWELSESNSTGKGGSFSGGIGASLIPLHFQLKFGSSWEIKRWDISKVKNGTTFTKSVLFTRIVTMTKRSSYTDLYFHRVNKTVRIYYNKRVVVF